MLHGTFQKIGEVKIHRLVESVYSRKEQDMQDHQQDKQENLLHVDLTRTILKCCFEVMNTLGARAFS